MCPAAGTPSRHKRVGPMLHGAIAASGSQLWRTVRRTRTYAVPASPRQLRRQVPLRRQCVRARVRARLRPDISLHRPRTRWASSTRNAITIRRHVSYRRIARVKTHRALDDSIATEARNLRLRCRSKCAVASACLASPRMTLYNRSPCRSATRRRASDSGQESICATVMKSGAVVGCRKREPSTTSASPRRRGRRPGSCAGSSSKSASSMATTEPRVHVMFPNRTGIPTLPPNCDPHGVACRGRGGSFRPSACVAFRR